MSTKFLFVVNISSSNKPSIETAVHQKFTNPSKEPNRQNVNHNHHHHHRRHLLPPPDLFDKTTIISLFSTIAILLAALALSRLVLSPSTPKSLRFLFIWHAFDALIHFFLEGSFLYHCFFSSVSVAKDGTISYYPNPHNYLGSGEGVVHGAQAGGENAFAQLWMVYARADKRWAGVDLGVVSLELLTVFVVGPLACLVCYDIVKKNPRANITMIILATAEIYGGFMTFCPEWLTGSVNLDTSNVVYLWLYLVFFNMLWVFIPAYAIWTSSIDIFDAFRVRTASVAGKKMK
ncbi:Emopamil binding protein-domain-containing protein [Bombardia bombarda]|uniref:Emopamil binding protein-domain-containing protein n=1 Tax=Bombardia bombarda TaxID=252184 RepID=A0AA40BW87_9PEZI|nr:Emopamil binding protein-domain-containing protein [Bombardia bombarda]